jgi:Ni,Fe-hydrogenase I large subunit
MAAASPPVRRLVVGPFNRVEGDLDVRLEVSGGRVAAAYVHASQYRGFENLLRGRAAPDALVIVPRICGICSISQSAAAVAALSPLCGAQAPANGRRAANLILASEVIADHLTHFYLFFMPDFARVAYAGQPWHAAVAGRFAAIRGSAGAQALRARAGLLRVLALLAGKWPHTLALRPGGTTRVINAAERGRLRRYLGEFRAFVEAQLLGGPLAEFVALDSAAALARWAADRQGDFAQLLRCAADAGLGELGAASDRFMASGAWPGEAGDCLFPAGVFDALTGETAAFAPAAITEDHSRAWLKNSARPLPPAEGVTEPDPDKAAAYSWCKAPRYRSQTMETGALARQLVAGHPLLHDLLRQQQGRVIARMTARQIEIARLLPAMEEWIAALDPRAPFLAAHGEFADGRAAGFVEAARGTLGHWLEVAGGRIAGYQIVAPTTWNFSPRDAAGNPGPLELALQGLPVADGEETPVSVQHVVRSFDPCMVCTVH